MYTPSPFELWLDTLPDKGLGVLCLHFELKGPVHECLRRTVGVLQENGVSYALVGSLAHFFHGLRRVTVDVDLLIASDALSRCREVLLANGYEASDRPRRLFEKTSGIAIDLHVAGAIVPSGEKRGFAWPEPDGSSVMIDGLKVLSLPAILNLKLSDEAPRALQLRHLADGMELIKAIRPPASFEMQLHPAVRSTYRRLWEVAQQPDPHEQGTYE